MPKNIKETAEHRLKLIAPNKFMISFKTSRSTVGGRK